MDLLTLVKKGRVPEYYTTLLPYKCSCGEVLNYAENLKTVTCDNIYCIEKLAKRISNMLSQLDIRGRGYSYCRTILENIRRIKEEEVSINNKDKGKLLFKDFFEYMDIHKYLYPTIYLTKEMFKNIKVPLHKAVALLNLDDISFKTSEYLFRGLNDLTEPLKYLSEEGNLTGWVFSKGKNSVEGSCKLGNTLAFYLEDIMYITELFTIIKSRSEVVPIAITGSVQPHGQSMSRGNFINYLNSLVDDIEFVDTKAHASAFKCVADSPSSSRTYKEGLKRGKLITSTELVDLIKGGQLNIWKKEL